MVKNYHNLQKSIQRDGETNLYDLAFEELTSSIDPENASAPDLLYAQFLSNAANRPNPNQPLTAEQRELGITLQAMRQAPEEVTTAELIDVQYDFATAFPA